MLRNSNTIYLQWSRFNEVSPNKKCRISLDNWMLIHSMSPVVSNVFRTVTNSPLRSSSGTLIEPEPNRIKKNGTIPLHRRCLQNHYCTNILTLSLKMKELVLFRIVKAIHYNEINNKKSEVGSFFLTNRKLILVIRFFLFA